MSITYRDKQELAQLYSDYKDKFGGCKEDYFAFLYLKHRFSRRLILPETTHRGQAGSTADAARRVGGQ